MRSISITLILLIVSPLQLLAINNGLGLTPQMGWNSWNHFGCSINEDLIKDTADALIATGLAKLGYRYVNLDDCWQIARDPTGVIIPDPVSFPSGIQALADYMHENGLLLGVYSDAGTETCQGRPGSLGYESTDAKTYAAWGVDYLKYDNCNNENIAPELRYPVMSDALNATGKPIFFSLCEWGIDNPATWAPKVGNSWRTTGDISDNWDSMIQNLENQTGLASYAGPGGWNDPDMLEVGNGGMTYDEYVSHFALWCLLKAPLIIGCDVTTITDETLSILNNTYLIAVNQDPLGVEGTRVNQTGDLEVWGGPLSGNATVAVLLNKGNSTANITAYWSDLNITYSNALVFDLINGVVIGIAADNYTASVNTHAVVAIKLTQVTAEDLELYKLI